MIVIDEQTVGQALAREHILACCEACSLAGDEARCLLMDLGGRIAGNVAWRAAFWRDVEAYRNLDYTCAHLPAELAADRPVYGALLIVLRVPEMHAVHRERGIPEEITRDTVRDIPLWVGQYAKRNGGRFGLDNLRWLGRHLGGTLYRIGRLQYVIRHRIDTVRVFRHRDSGDYVLVMSGGKRVRRDGVCLAGDGDPEAWLTRFELDVSRIIGHTVSPDGVVARDVTVLRAADYDAVVDSNTLLLNVHIPGDGPLDVDACNASMRDAVAFFARYFPEDRYAGFYTWTWFLDNQMPGLLPATSNIVRWQKVWHRFPIYENHTQCCERVFGTKEPDLDTAPRETRMQRAFLDFLRRGGRFHAQAGWMPLD